MAAPLKLSLIVSASSKDAEAAVARLDSGLDNLGASAERAGTRGRNAFSVISNDGRKAAAGGELAAGSIGNLTANFNDLGVMLAAGQNPLQLALQQGTQISQVFSGATLGATIRGVGSAFMSLISPVSLVTIGLIAGGAALFQWATGADEVVEKAKTVAEVQREMVESVDAYIDASKRASMSDADRIAQYGALSLAAKQLSEDQKQFERDASLAKIGTDVATALAPLDDLKKALWEANSVGYESGIELARSIGLTRDEIVSLTAAMEQARAADTFEEQAVAAQALVGLITQIADDLGYMPPELEAIASSMGVVFDKAAEANVEFGKMPPILAAVASGAAAAATNVGNIASQAYAGFQKLQKMARAINSVENFQAGGLAAQYSQYVQGRVQGERLVAESGSLYGGNGRLDLDPPGSGSGAGAGAGSGGGGAARQAQGLQSLIEAQERELELLRETDPVQKELLRHRQAMEGATSAERAQLEQLITARQAEEAQIKASAEASKFWRDTLYGGFEDLILKGASFKETLGSIAGALAKMLLQSALLGTGPLNSLFGGGGLSGGLLGLIGLGGARAGGGPVGANQTYLVGENGPELLSMGPNPGHIFNQGQVRAGLRGDPRSASVSPSAQQLQATPQRVEVHVSLSDDLDAKIASRSREVAAEVTRAGLDTYSDRVLPGLVQGISNDPRARR